ncbi:MAG: hypothetical protein KGL39_37425 [Patescibacteria group bacterium]|nr:hypothetical protein [Patescibacteria group bacterium]
MTSSNSTSFSPSNSDIVLTAFRRIGIRSAEITNEHMVSARMALNMVQASWSNMGVNLWRVDTQTVPLVQGITTYGVPSDTIMILDAYIRLYSMGNPYNAAPSFSTMASSPTVTINWPSNGLSVSNYINIVIPISVSGIVLYGFYQVTSVLSTSNFTITAASSAISTVNNGGAVPVFTTALNSNTVNVLLNNHGYLSGQSFVVQVATTLGGITLYASYTITSVIDANNFTINSAYPASSIATASENTGLAQLVPQNTSAHPVDRVMNPISRTDYSALPNKSQQGFPTIMWFDRLINPTLTLWQVPDGNGPYELIYYRSIQIQDANPQMGQTPNLPYRFLEAITADLSLYLAREWNTAMEPQRKMDADSARAIAMSEDRERVGLMLDPDMASYYW